VIPWLVLALALGPAHAGKKRPLVWAEVALPTTMDPLRPATPVDRRVHALVYDHLFYRDTEGWKSRVLEDIAVSEDGRLHAKVASQIRWHDGERLRPLDVCHSIEMLTQDADSPFHRHQSARPVHCEIDTEKTGVTISFTEQPLSEPRAALAIPLLPAHGDTDARGHTHPIGTGPMRAHFARGSWHFEAWPAASQPSHIPALKLHVEPDRNAQVEDLLAGSIDGMIAVPPKRLPELRQAGMSLRYYDPERWWYVALNTALPPLDDPSVRAELDAHLDRDALRERLITTDPEREEQACRLITGPFSPDSPRYNRGVLPAPPTDSAPRPLGLRVAVPNTLDLEGRGILDALLEQWDGFGVTGSVVSPGSDLEAFHAVVGTWSHGEDIAQLYHSPTAHLGLANPFGTCDVQLDRLFRDMGTADSDLEHHQLSRELHAALADQRAHLFLWELGWWSAWRPGIEHQVISPGDYFGQLGVWKLP